MADQKEKEKEEVVPEIDTPEIEMSPEEKAAADKAALPAIHHMGDVVDSEIVKDQDEDIGINAFHDYVTKRVASMLAPDVPETEEPESTEDDIPVDGDDTVVIPDED